MTDGEVTQRIEKRDGQQVVVTFKGGKEVSVEPHIRPITGYLPGTTRAFVAGRGISKEEEEAAQKALEQRLEAEALTRAEEQRLAEIEKAQQELRKAQEAERLRSQAQMIEQPTVSATIEEQAGIMRPTVSPLAISRRAISLIQETAREAAEKGLTEEDYKEYLRTQRADIIADLPRATVAKIKRLSEEAAKKGLTVEQIEDLETQIKQVRLKRKMLGQSEEQVRAKVTRKDLEELAEMKERQRRMTEVRPEVILTEAGFAAGQRILSGLGQQFAPTLTSEIGSLAGAGLQFLGYGVGIATAERALREPIAEGVVGFAEQTGILGAFGYERRAEPGVSPFTGITEPILDPLANIGEGLIGYVTERPLEFATGLGVSAVVYYSPEILRSAGSTLKAGGKSVVKSIKDSKLANKVSRILKRDKTDVLDVEKLTKAYRRGEITQSEIDQITRDLWEGAQVLVQEARAKQAPFIEAGEIVAPGGRGFIERTPFDIFGSELDELTRLGVGEASERVTKEAGEEVLKINLGGISDDLSRITSEVSEEVAEQAQRTTQSTQLAMKPQVTVERKAEVQAITLEDILPPGSQVTTGVTAPIRRRGIGFPLASLLGPLFEEEAPQQVPTTAEEQLLEEVTETVPSQPTLTATLPTFMTFVAAASAPVVATEVVQETSPTIQYLFDFQTPQRPVPRAPPKGAVGGGGGRGADVRRRGYLTLPGEEYTASVGAVLLGLTAEEVPMGAELALRPQIRKGGKQSARRKPKTRSKQKPKPKSKPKRKTTKRKARGFLSDLEQINIGI